MLNTFGTGLSTVALVLRRCSRQSGTRSGYPICQALHWRLGRVAPASVLLPSHLSVLVASATLSSEYR
jgi:hypothetical protein